jgi:hypothetical protein
MFGKIDLKAELEESQSACESLQVDNRNMVELLEIIAAKLGVEWEYNKHFPIKKTVQKIEELRANQVKPKAAKVKAEKK